jgi:protein-disulfide isomerase
MATTLLPRSRDAYSSEGVSLGVSASSDVGRLPSVARKRPAQKRATRARAPAPAKKTSGTRVVLAFGIAIAVAVALIAVAVLTRNDEEESSPNPTAATIDFTGIPQDGAFLGAPDTGVTLIEYADLQCPACRAYSESILPGVVEQYVRPGEVRAEWRGLAFIGDDSQKALRFVQAAGLQDRLWNLQDALYRNQGGENSGWVTDDLIRELAAEIPGLDVDQLFTDAESPEVASRIANDAATAGTNEVTGTPTLLIQIGDEEPYKIDATDVAAALDDALGR